MLAPAPRFVAQSSVVGVLYDLGTYPGLRLNLGAVLAPAQTVDVQGEVYEIDVELLPVLDAIEGISPGEDGEYARVSVEVAVCAVPLVCWTYEVNPTHVNGKLLIASGNWIAYRKASFNAAPTQD